MARPTARTRDPISDAVIRLRQALGDSQQQFANRTGTAVGTVARYETSRPPKGKVLARFARLAEEAGRHDIAKNFAEALEGELGPTQAAFNQIEQMVALGSVEIYRAMPRQFIAFIEKILKAAKRRDPIRSNQLESLLVLLRKDSGPAKRKFESRIAEIATRDGVSRERATFTLMLEEPELIDAWNREHAAAGAATMFEETMAVRPAKARRDK
jgi:transcriptional regulator with XRE-family HTH domain